MRRTIRSQTRAWTLRDAASATTLSMAIWPFRRRRSNIGTTANSPPPPPLSEKPHNAPAPAPVRRPSRRSSRKRKASQTDKAAEAQSPEGRRKRGGPAADKENLPRRKGSVEDITALPISYQLGQSPHLRPIDTSRTTQVPYNFREGGMSQTSISRTEAKASRPNTLRSKRSTYDNTPQRRRSSKKRKDDDRLREEEIRAMNSSPIPIPKRAGDGILRKDSRKRRNMTSMIGSNVSLPHQESLHSSMSGMGEQRGWEVGNLDIFNPRPAIRLSGAAQYTSHGSFLGHPPTSRDGVEKSRDKRPVTRDSARKRQTIGKEADDMDASDLRLLLERDAKRKERRMKEQQAKLDRKLRARAGSNKKRREAEEARREQEMRERADQEPRARAMMTPPSDVHPALRGQPVFEQEAPVGLGIEESRATPFEDQTHATPTTEELGTANTGTYLDYKELAKPQQDPFADPLPSPAPENDTQRLDMPGAFTPVETPMEDPTVETAKAVRLSQHMSRASSPPLSPIESRQGTPSISQISSSLRQERTASLPEAPPVLGALDERRTSEPKRVGAWATFFRRGGTNLKKQDDAASPRSQTSFQNTSRESMSRGPIPAHLLGEQQTSAFQRRKSGTPTRTQSKFREDLPEMPMSPPDSRVQSPDVPDLPVGAAAIAAAHGRKRSSKQDPAAPSNRVSDSAVSTRYDTPVSPSGRARGLVSASMASVDSEGSWLASGGSMKRASLQSGGPSRMGSLSQRRNEFSASYEELGGDRDAEYLKRNTPSPDPARTLGKKRVSSSVLTGADEESEYGEETASPPPNAENPLTVHDSVRRKPTLVHRDPIARSREGLLTDFSAGESATIEGGESISDPDSPIGESQVHRATSVSLGRGHVRQMSAGSAKLLDLPPSRRQSVSPATRDRDSTYSIGSGSKLS